MDRLLLLPILKTLATILKVVAIIPSTTETILMMIARVLRRLEITMGRHVGTAALGTVLRWVMVGSSD